MKGAVLMAEGAMWANTDAGIMAGTPPKASANSGAKGFFSVTVNSFDVMAWMLLISDHPTVDQAVTAGLVITFQVVMTSWDVTGLPLLQFALGFK